MLMLLVAAWTLTLALIRRARTSHGQARGLLEARVLAVAGLQVAIIGSAAMWWFLPAFPVALFLGTLSGMIAGSLAAQVWLWRQHRGEPIEPIRLLVAGHTTSSDRAEAALTRDLSVRVQGRCRPTVPAILRALEKTHCDAVLVLPCSHLDPIELRRLEWQLAEVGVDLMISTGLVDVSLGRTRVSSVADLSMVHVRHSELDSWRRTAQHLAGRVLAATLLCIAAPVLLVLMLGVRLDSPGPAIYRQQRIGRGGRVFTMYKLRTMTVESAVDTTLINDSDGVLFKMRQDPRITRIGTFLRRYSLDELPQLVNVVRGEMALVGPRPALEREVAEYSTDVARRLAVQPGITGLWQVSGRSDLAWDESVRLDLTYVDNWHPGSDLRILARTVGAVITHRGAY
ncbi:exopolysaccharide biosynthesis polyprenyl glycosylphosphotransferase [Nocardioides daedukensis]|uniref:Exopolysaccharide biosynthesis polyprenyl glycosylphosphotransferase n=1 Tax=Nocardioides daedukensis TaxID=634462 RepID=A0A7Y9S0X8_9ACTN|nr:sugar transferase [Nocardioides daedukensis]NYG60276.1 exopolysaccharide biosynthesis polyprenyl glycosylphosphotransferase [Nocardioides daedukensis]